MTQGGGLLREMVFARAFVEFGEVFGFGVCGLVSSFE